MQEEQSVYLFFAIHAPLLKEARQVFQHEQLLTFPNFFTILNTSTVSYSIFFCIVQSLLKVMTEQQPDKGKCSGRERIIKAAELSRPAFYYHFTEGKEELRAELVRRGLLDDIPTQDTRLAILEAAVRI